MASTTSTSLHSKLVSNRFAAAHKILILAIILLGFALRVWRLDAYGLWFDEVGQASAALSGPSSAIQRAAEHHGAAPLDYLFTWLALQIAHNDFMVRIPAVLAGALSLALIYQVGRSLFDRNTAALAALLLAVSPFHLRYSQEARFYALFTCLTLALTWTFLLALQRNTLRAWLLYTLLLVLGLYTHYFVPLVVLVQGILVILASVFPRTFPWNSPAVARVDVGRRSILASFAGSCAVAALAFLPWLYFGVLQETGWAEAVPPAVSGSWIKGIVGALVLGLAVDRANPLPQWPVWMYAGLALVGMIAGLHNRSTRFGALLATLSVVVLPFLMDALIHIVNYFFAWRQMLYLLPSFLLLVSLGAASLVRAAADLLPRATRRPALTAVFALAAVLVLVVPLRPAIQYSYRAHGLEWGGDWRTALGFIDANARPTDMILAPPRIPLYYLDYYLPARKEQMRNSPPKQAQALVAGHSAGWIVTVDPEPFESTLSTEQVLDLEFGALHVMYWRPGQDRQFLLSEIRQWTPPSNPNTVVELAQDFLDSGFEDGLVDYFSRAEALIHDDEVFRNLVFAEANFWRKNGNTAQAIEDYQRVTQRWPSEGEAWVRLGEELLAADRVDEAESALQQALHLTPDHYWAHLYLGQVRQQQGDYQQAAGSFRAAIALQPENALAYALLGDTLAALHDDVAAMTAYEKYLELDPSSPRAARVREKLAALRPSITQ